MANFSTATELANFLVSKHQVPFREAHHIVGSLVGKLVLRCTQPSFWSEPPDLSQVAAKKNLTAIDDVMAHLAERGVKGADKASVLKVTISKCSHSLTLFSTCRCWMGSRSCFPTSPAGELDRCL